MSDDKYQSPYFSIASEVSRQSLRDAFQQYFEQILNYSFTGPEEDDESERTDSNPTS